MYKISEIYFNRMILFLRIIEKKLKKKKRPRKWKTFTYLPEVGKLCSRSINPIVSKLKKKNPKKKRLKNRKGTEVTKKVMKKDLNEEDDRKNALLNARNRFLMPRFVHIHDFFLREFSKPNYFFIFN